MASTRSGAASATQTGPTGTPSILWQSRLERLRRDSRVGRDDSRHRERHAKQEVAGKGV